MSPTSDQIERFLQAQENANTIAAAQVHATLALAAATEENFPERRDQTKHAERLVGLAT